MTDDDWKQHVTDDDWKQHVATLNTPLEILEELVKFIDDGFCGYDPYYSDLRDAVVDQAKNVIEREKP